MMPMVIIPTGPESLLPKGHQIARRLSCRGMPLVDIGEQRRLLQRWCAECPRETMEEWGFSVVYNGF